jgi:hypothetical protein
LCLFLFLPKVDKTPKALSVIHKGFDKAFGLLVLAVCLGVF